MDECLLSCSGRKLISFKVIRVSPGALRVSAGAPKEYAHEHEQCRVRSFGFQADE